MSSWSIDPVGGFSLTAVLGLLLFVALIFAPIGLRLSARCRAVLVALRGATALLLLLVMLRPSLVTTETKQIPGSLILLADASRSMQVADSLADASRWNALRSMLDSASDQLAELSQAWDIHLYQFDENAQSIPLEEDGHVKLADQPEGPQTAIGSVLDDVLQQHSQQRVVAVLLMSDGAQRAFAPRDLPPQTVVRRMAADDIPLYTFAFGQPALGTQSDLRIEDLTLSDMVFSETPVAVRATVGAEGYVNQSFKVQLLWEQADGTMATVDTQELQIDNSRRQTPITLTHTPTEPGEYKVSIQIDSPAGELVTSNNIQSTFVNVMKGGVNILYMAGATRVGGGPGLEPRFIRSALAPHDDLNVRFELFDYRKPRIRYRDRLLENNYNVYLLGNVDVSALDPASWQQISEDVEQGAGLAMLGGFHSFGPGGFRDSPLNDVLPIVMGPAERQNFGDPPRQDMHVAGPLKIAPVRMGNQIHPIMRLLTEELSGSAWSDLPALDGANRFERTRLKPNAQVIAESTGARRWPLLVIGAWGEGRTVAAAFDSTWRWRLEGFGEAQRRFWRQLVLWLARKDESQDQAVWVRLDQRRYQRGSHVGFTLGTGKTASEPLSPDSFKVEVVLPDETVVPVRASHRGEVLVGRFQDTDVPGDYRVRVTARDEDLPQEIAEARFTVPDLDMELDQPASEPTLLESLAHITAEAGGAGLAPEEFNDLLDDLLSRTEEYEEEVSVKASLWDTWPTFLLIVALLSSEWLLRKRWGLV